MSNNNNNSDKTYLIAGIVCFLCYISSGASLFIRHIIKSDTSKKSPSQSPSQSPSPSPSPSPAPAADADTFQSGCDKAAANVQIAAMLNQGWQLQVAGSQACLVNNCPEDCWS